MGLSLRVKLVAAFVAFVVVLFGLSGVLFVREKTQEMAQTIFMNTAAFSDFTAKPIIDDFELNWLNKNDAYFNKTVVGFLNRNTDIPSIQIASYQGEILYDYKVEKQKRYMGQKRIIQDMTTLSQIQSQYTSARTEDRALFLKKTADGNIAFLDSYGKTIDPLKQSEMVDAFVSPVDNKYAVFYYLDYKNVDIAVTNLEKRIAMLGAFGIILGIMLAYVFASRITKPISSITQGAAVLAKGDFTYQVHVKTGDELEVLASAFNTMAKEIEKSTKAMVYKERVSKELELAAKIQKEILPKQIPQNKFLDIAAGLIPAEEIGGDLYDFIPMQDRLLMYIGDVTGHGVPAGLVSSIANALLFTFSNKPSAKDIMVEANRVLKVKTLPNMFMTIGLLDFNEITKKITYVNAGHEPLLYFNAKENKVIPIELKGIALGMFPDISTHLDVKEIEMASGDVLLAYSDGIPEAWKSEKENYGMARLKRVFNDCATMPSSLAIRNAILSDVKEFTAGYKQMDDITLVAVKMK
ncbi:SpoIIE family protein phosphatase [Candidatus Peregrinibacteria bacterium]|nr:SpoIIE family protein phosphatase [Candidatus Peregrinibacteria bacterium]